jgi:hypothetical protein
MAKQTKKVRPTTRIQAPKVMIHSDLPEPAVPSQKDFKRAREFLRQRAVVSEGGGAKVGT